jgi:hypothetical protein
MRIVIVVMLIVSAILLSVIQRDAPSQAPRIQETSPSLSVSRLVNNEKRIGRKSKVLTTNNAEVAILNSMQTSPISYQRVSRTAIRE